MSNQLINLLDSSATGFNRIADFVKTLAGGDSEMPLAEVLMIGFIGYFFDRMKLSLLPVESNVKTKNRQG